MDPSTTRKLPLSRPQPSQLYVDGAKLASALEWWSFDGHGYDPIPMLEMDGEPVITDGHTRAFLAYLSGHETLLGTDDPDRVHRPMYRECVRWCREESVTEVAHLVGRVVSAETFRERWIERCHASPLYDQE